MKPPFYRFDLFLVVADVDTLVSFCDLARFVFRVTIDNCRVHKNTIRYATDEFTDANSSTKQFNMNW